MQMAELNIRIQTEFAIFNEKRQYLYLLKVKVLINHQNIN